MMDKVLVGRGIGRYFSQETLKEWVSKTWGERLEVAPKVQTLAKGWFMLKFMKKEEVEWVLKSPWHLDSAPILLKKWSLLFDASREREDELLIWARLLVLPVELWTKEGFRLLGNTMGTFLDTDMSFLETKKMLVAQILVFLNIKKGQVINLNWRGNSLVHKLDYEGIMFKCRRCHKHGHVAKECELPFLEKKGV
jgi:hypothetical protein